MLTLHGFPFSNYYNIIKHALMYKNIAFEERIAYPGSPELMAVSPAGKAPAMTTDSGAHLTESSVLCDYLDDAYPQNPLYPTAPEARASVRQLMKITELYLELPARRFLPAVFGDVQFDEETKAEIRSTLERGVKGLNALASFSPYLTGAELTMADIYLRYALAIPKMVGPAQLDWDILASVPGLQEWDAIMADTDIARKVDADMEANTADFMAYITSNAS
ncbi:MAG: glutathione S-transferase family protein [Halieaceae bacterium]|jgi:glutathione S-transferase|nr:glutathione S-transferase family protein [Halieaceae bacterium]